MSSAPTRRLRRLRAALWSREHDDIGTVRSSATAIMAAPDDDARSPWTWDASDWKAMRTRPARRRLLKHDALACIDRQAFLRDGCAC
eukprot:SAG31_NODE_3164_length_4602_cov_7.602043_4_plen_87_part_00